MGMKNKARQTIPLFILFILCTLSLFALPGRRAEGAAGIPQGESVVRVALGLGQSTASVTVRQGAYRLMDPDRGTEAGTAAAGQTISVSPSGSGLRVTMDGAEQSISGSRVVLSASGSEPDILAYGTRSYRGSMLIENKNAALNIINVLDVDHYLLGVLPMEMGLSTVPAEALKAQAIVSRTFALKRKSAGGASYDLESGASDQVYGGYGNERAYTSAAVEATKGKAIYYEGQLIEAFFSSNSGGHTEDAENVWNEALPYAKAIASPYDAYALEALQDAAGYPGVTYNWQVRFTIAELQERITEWNRDNPENRIPIGNFRLMTAYAYDYDPVTGKITDRPNASGRVTRLDLAGDGGVHSLYKTNVRALLGLRSTLFNLRLEGGIAVRNGAGVTVMLDQSIRDAKALAADGQAAEINPGSDSFYIVTAEGVEERSKDQAATITAFVLDGKGYGHGVGMSQWGAIGMAQAGMTCEQIIEHYFNQGRNDGKLVIK
ncbi:MAG: SpoIID/LytB domain-containing protein [Clostridiales bacterium]|nr:SpoIID/LytB domain-containing protein [Clostridiales bacterium]